MTRKKLEIFRLEDRVLFEAAAAGDIVDVQENDPGSEAGQEAQQTESETKESDGQTNVPPENQGDAQQNKSESDDQDSSEAQNTEQSSEGGDINSDIDGVIDGEVKITADDSDHEDIDSFIDDVFENEQTSEDDDAETLLLNDNGEAVSTGKELVIISGNVLDAESIISELGASQEVLILDPSRDGMEQIHEYLENSDTKYDAVHIVSHGNAGYLYINDQIYDAENFNAADWAGIGKHLTDNGDIMLYGCNLAENEAGRDFVAMIADASGADVAASTNSTGLTGDWVLEYEYGLIETTNITVESYEYRLATYNVTSGANSGTNTLRWALGLATADGDIIYIASTVTSISVETTINITAGVSITGQGASQVTITMVGTGVITPYSRIFNITGGKSVTMENLNLVGQGNARDHGAVIYAGAESTLTLTNVNLSNGSAVATTAGYDGGAIYMGSDSTLNMTNVVISNCKAGGGTNNGSGGAIYMGENGTIVMNNTTLQNNTANGTVAGREGGYGGAIYMATGGSLTIIGSTISGNSANYGDGGGIYIASGTASITGSTLSGNTANTHGGGIYAGAGTSLTLTNTNISNCESGTSTNRGHGGGIFLGDNGSLIINGGTYSNNTAAHAATRGDGGTIYIGAGATVTITGLTIIGSGNVARQGGAIYFSGGTGSSFTSTNLNISGVSAANGNGGAIYLGSATTASITGGTIASCTASDYGGGVYIAGGTVNFYGVIISVNRAGTGNGGLGGGVYVAGGTVTFDAATTIGNNTAGNGGGIYINNGTVTFNGTTVNGNHAVDSGVDFGQESGGGGVYINNGVVTFNQAAVTGNDSAGSGGGGILVLTGTVFINGGTISSNNATGTVGGGRGGGLFMKGGNVALTGVSMTNNSTYCSLASSEGGAGGAIFIGGGALLVDTCTITGNSTDTGTGTLYKTVGAGIYISTGIVMINNTYIGANQVKNGNSNNGGAGIYMNGGTLTLANSTLTGNILSQGNGSGINHAGGTLSILNSIITGNTGGTYDLRVSSNSRIAYSLYGTLTGTFTSTVATQSGITAASIFGVTIPEITNTGAAARSGTLTGKIGATDYYYLDKTAADIANWVWRSFTNSTTYAFSTDAATNFGLGASATVIGTAWNTGGNRLGGVELFHYNPNPLVWVFNTGAWVLDVANKPDIVTTVTDQIDPYSWDSSFREVIMMWGRQNTVTGAYEVLYDPGCNVLTVTSALGEIIAEQNLTFQSGFAVTWGGAATDKFLTFKTGYIGTFGDVTLNNGLLSGDYIFVGTTAGTSTMNGGDVIYRGTSAQTIFVGTYGDLTIEGSGAKTLGGATTVTGDMLINGTDNTNYVQFNGNGNTVTIGAGKFDATYADIQNTIFSTAQVVYSYNGTTNTVTGGNNTNLTIYMTAESITGTDITYGDTVSTSTLSSVFSIRGVNQSTPPVTLLTGGDQIPHVARDASYVVIAQTIAGLTFSWGDYAVTNTTLTLKVNPKQVTLTSVTANDKTYDGTTDGTLKDYTFDGEITGESLGLSATVTFAYADVRDDNYAIITNLQLQDGTNALASDYELITTGPINDNNAKITAKAITITSVTNDTYGDTTIYTNSEGLSLTYTGTFDTSAGTSTSGNYNAGSHTVNGLGSLKVNDGNLGNNYIISYSPGLSFTVAQKALGHDVLVDPTKVYDTTDSAGYTGGLTAADIVTGDIVSLDAVLYYINGPNVQTDGPIGTRSWGLTGADAANYSLAAFGTQTASITAKAITITDVTNNTYGDAVVYTNSDGLTLTYTGEFDTDLGLSSTDHYKAGSHTVNGLGSLKVDDGNQGNNYIISYSPGLNFTVAKKALSHDITVDPTKVYDGSALAGHTGGLTTGDIITGDDVSLNSYMTLYYANGANVQTNGAIAAWNWEVVGADAENYALDGLGQQTASITQRSITVIVDHQEKLQNTSDPELTFRIDGDGLVAGDGYTGALARVSGEALGEYLIHMGSLNFGGNYAVTFIGHTLTILPGLDDGVNTDQYSEGFNPNFSGEYARRANDLMNSYHDMSDSMFFRTASLDSGRAIDLYLITEGTEAKAYSADFNTNKIQYWSNGNRFTQIHVENGINEVSRYGNVDFSDMRMVDDIPSNDRVTLYNDAEPNNVIIVEDISAGIDNTISAASGDSLIPFKYQQTELYLHGPGKEVVEVMPMPLNDVLLDDMVYAIAGTDYYPSKVFAFNDDLDLALAELIG